MLLGATLLGATAAAAASASVPGSVPGSVPLDAGAFVRTDATGFVVAGRRLGLVGANLSVMHGAGPRAAIDATLDAAQRDGLTVIRVWALGEAPSDAPAWRHDHAFRVGEGGWLEPSYLHLDRVLAGARARGLRVILVLANRWSAYGGVPELLRFAGRPPAGAEATSAELDGFFGSAPATEHWRAHARRLLERTNVITGVAYAADPTILSWELMNELSADGHGAAERLTAWISAQAAFVHALAPKQLVSAGHIGYLGRVERRTWARVCALPGIDYCDSHAYPEQDPRVLVPADLRRWIGDRAAIARRLGKPMIFGEVGVRTLPARFRGLGAAIWYDAFFRAAHAEGVAGVLAWIVEPFTGRARDFGIYVEDTGHARTGPVRRVLARWAARARAAPPGPPRAAAAAWFTPGPVLEGAATAHASWQRTPGGALLAIDPTRIRRARFDAAGIWREGTLAHVYGSGPGFVEYAIGTPTGLGASAGRLRARLSSELPGAGDGAGPEDGARIVVTIDGLTAGVLAAPPDDGLGAERVLELPEAAARRLARPGRHVLRFEALEEPGASGLCLYGDATGRWPIPPDVRAELPGRIVLELAP